MAHQLRDQGYDPLPIKPGTKMPCPAQWTTLELTEARIDQWAKQYPTAGIGLRTGWLVGLDIDILDPDSAHRIDRLAIDRLGDTLLRVGRWPKRLRLYRTDRPYRKLKVPGVEVLGLGQQLVAFGIHPDTGKPYSWPFGDTPLEVPLEDLPLLNEAQAKAFLGEVSGIIPEPARQNLRRGVEPDRSRHMAFLPVRDDRGLVIDGRDAWLSSIAFHAVHDARDRAEPLDPTCLTERVWERFLTTTEIYRARQDRSIAYGVADAAQKVADKFRLLAEGRLPERQGECPTPEYSLPTLSVDKARERLDDLLQDACGRVSNWHAGEVMDGCPQIGIRATVGLGKSASARRHLIGLMQHLTEVGAPTRILVFTPSHALAEETAKAWENGGVASAVLRGYMARHPVLNLPMCKETQAVAAAIKAGEDVQSTACAGPSGRKCQFFEGCLKQANRREVETAQVVVAPYDGLYSGFAVDPASIGQIVIDESCWPRAIREEVEVGLESFGSTRLGMGRWKQKKDKLTGDRADLDVLRQKALRAFAANGDGGLARSALRRAGLMAADCWAAAGLERDRLVSCGLHPGMTAAARAAALPLAERNAEIRSLVAVWSAMASLLDQQEDRDGRVRLIQSSNGNAAIRVSGLHLVHVNFRDKPVLHLDATLRPDLIQPILPRLKVTTIEAAAPNMAVRLITGSFGKSMICPDALASPEETQRRQNRLTECVDYVRWHARRIAPRRTLVVTYKACEPAFEGILGVEAAHFNAIAGLDCYGDVGLLIVIGRPLPPASALNPMCGALFGHDPKGSYHSVSRGIWMRDGSRRAVRTIAHQDQQAEELRASICDDEVIQAIGRGRGVNRTADHPLQVHVLADIALPLVHDQLLSWETEVPNIVQRMLLEGIAVDSPADAMLLHPELFGSVNQAKKAFQRTAFGGQNPISNLYREMTPKCAQYRRNGKGRSWQNVYWLDGSDDDVRIRLERFLGRLGGWLPK